MNEGATWERFATFRGVIDSWIDFDRMRTGYEGMRHNPEAADWLGRVKARGVRRERHRLWLKPPFHFRHEAGDGRIQGLADELAWNVEREGREVWTSSTGGSVGMLVPAGSPSVNVKAEFTVSLHPILSELFEPPDFFEAEMLEELAHAGRPARRIRVPYDPREHGHGQENFMPADDYVVTVDEATGVLLRVGERFDGKEFSVRDMTEVAFDEPIDPALFAPPLGLPEGRWPPRLASDGPEGV